MVVLLRPLPRAIVEKQGSDIKVIEQATVADKESQVQIITDTENTRDRKHKCLFPSMPPRRESLESTKTRLVRDQKFRTERRVQELLHQRKRREMEEIYDDSEGIYDYIWLRVKG